MANTVISLKKSSTSAAVPSSLANGELAINFADGKLFYKNTAGYIAEISGGGPGGGNSFGTINANSTLIVADSTNDFLTIEAGSGIAIVGDAINDKITISTTSTGASVSVSDTAPVSPSNGDLWFNSSLGKLLIYYNDGTSSQWVESYTTAYATSNASSSSGISTGKAIAMAIVFG